MSVSLKVACCQVGVSTKGLSLVHRSSTERGVCECNSEASIRGVQGPLGLSGHEKKQLIKFKE
jgi:hypothetical protein